MPINFVMQGKCLFSDISRPGVVNFNKKKCMNMNYNYPTTIFRSTFTQMYKFRVEKDIFTIFAYELFKVKIKNCK